MNPSADVLEKNIFRVLALPVKATEREIIARLDELTTWARIGKAPLYPRDKIWPGPVPRDLATIQMCSQILRSPTLRVEHVLAWFWENDKKDKTALKALMLGDPENSEIIWLYAFDQSVDCCDVTSLKNLAMLHIRQVHCDGLLPGKAKYHYEKAMARWQQLAGVQAFFESGKKIAGCGPEFKIETDIIAKVKEDIEEHYALRNNKLREENPIRVYVAALPEQPLQKTTGEKKPDAANKQKGPKKTTSISDDFKDSAEDFFTRHPTLALGACFGIFILFIVVADLFSALTTPREHLPQERKLLDTGSSQLPNYLLRKTDPQPVPSPVCQDTGPKYNYKNEDDSELPEVYETEDVSASLDIDENSLAIESVDNPEIDASDETEVEQQIPSEDQSEDDVNE